MTFTAFLVQRFMGLAPESITRVKKTCCGLVVRCASFSKPSDSTEFGPILVAGCMPLRGKPYRYHFTDFLFLAMKKSLGHLGGDPAAIQMGGLGTPKVCQMWDSG
jgi:hypothetical protein